MKNNNAAQTIDGYEERPPFLYAFYNLDDVKNGRYYRGGWAGKGSAAFNPDDMRTEQIRLLLDNYNTKDRVLVRIKNIFLAQKTMQNFFLGYFAKKG